MVDAAVIFGANRSNAETEFRDVLQFEIELAKVNENCVAVAQETNALEYNICIFLIVSFSIHRFHSVMKNVAIKPSSTIHLPFNNCRPHIPL